ncbi:MAG: glycosyltransferase [Betaproteobacteria bacterium]|nr:glycosyltransferase [Betaproteobacteria bacterium]
MDLRIYQRPLSNGKQRFAHLLQLFAWYADLRREAARKGAPEIVWIDEFLFNPADLLLAKLACIGSRSLIVSGPHVLRQDHQYYSSLKYALGSPPIPVMRSIKHALVDWLCLASVDVVQSYSTQYANRLKNFPLMRSKPSVLCPIGLPAELDRLPAWSFPKEDINSVLKVAFWGGASPLHGLSLLAIVAAQLRDRGIHVHFSCLTPETDCVARLRQRIAALKVESSFAIVNIRAASTSFQDVIDSHIAISHLIEPDVSMAAIDAFRAVTTNKMMEILALGVPLLIADTEATCEFVNGSEAFLVPPGSAEAIVNVIESILRNPAILNERADAAGKMARRTLTAEAVGTGIADQLRQLLAPRDSSNHL